MSIAGGSGSSSATVGGTAGLEAMEENSADPGTALDMPGAMPGQGCNIEGEFYMDGMQVKTSLSIFNI